MQERPIEWPVDELPEIKEMSPQGIAIGWIVLPNRVQ
jgi:hypothetical protein